MKSGLVIAEKKIDFLTAGGRTTAYVPKLQKLSGKDAEKAAKVRPGKRGVKSKEDDGAGEEDEEESEKQDDIAKPKKRQEPKGCRGKKPASKRNTENSDNGDNDDDSGEDSEAEEKSCETKRPWNKACDKEET